MELVTLVGGIGAGAGAGAGALSLNFHSSSSCCCFCSTHRRLSLSRSESSLARGLNSLSLSATSLAFTDADSAHPLQVCCGRGDRKTAKGKRFAHSFGNCRPRNKKKGRGPPRPPMTPSKRPKDDEFDGEIIEIEIDDSLE